MHSMQHQYSFWLVALSYGISVFGSFAALLLARRIPAATGGGTRWGWVSSAAIALGGCGIWAMHFIAMLAYRMEMPVRYDLGLTLLSMIIAIGVTGLGFSLVGVPQVGSGRLILAGLLMGGGVAAMHYMGMAAMQMQADLRYDPTLVAVSILIAVIAAIVALWLAFNLKSAWMRVAAAFVMGVAVCGMHYTGMAATTMVPNDRQILFEANAVAPVNLGFYIFLASFGVLVTLMLVLLWQRLTAGSLYEA